MLIDQTSSPVSDDLHSINEGLFHQFANQEGLLSGWLDKGLFCCTQKLLRLTAELTLLCLLLAFTLFAVCPRENSLTRHDIPPKFILCIDLDSFLMNLVISQRKKILFVLFQLFLYQGELSWLPRYLVCDLTLLALLCLALYALIDLSHQVVGNVAIWNIGAVVSSKKEPFSWWLVHMLMQVLIECFPTEDFVLAQRIYCCRLFNGRCCWFPARRFREGGVVILISLVPFLHGPIHAIIVRLLAAEPRLRCSSRYTWVLLLPRWLQI